MFFSDKEVQKLFKVQSKNPHGTLRAAECRFFIVEKSNDMRYNKISFLRVQRKRHDNSGFGSEIVENTTLRKQLDAYTKEKYDIEPEILPFSHENYEIYRHVGTGKWFAVFVVKERCIFGLDGDGTVEILCVKPKDQLLADFLMQQPGYLRGYPSKGWNWISVVLDGTVPFEDISRWLDESYQATKSKTQNKKTPLPKRETSC